MTPEEFLLHVPFYQGLHWAALAQHPRRDMQEEGRTSFWRAPLYFALCELARRHMSEFEALCGEAKATAMQRYSANEWEDPAAETVHNLLRGISPEAFDLIEKAITLAKHWRDQEGANVAIIDGVCDAAEAYQRANGMAHGEKEPCE
jgi:hypothetical protein